MLKLRTIPVGLIATNCCLIYDESRRELYIVDPGGDAELIAAAAKEYPADRIRVLLTHAHVDHISGLGELAQKLKLESVWVHPDDAEMYYSPENALPPWIPAARNLPQLDVREPQIPGMQILHLPGHTPGGAGFYFTEEKMIFSGDTLFAGSVGRTDLPGGSWEALKHSIENILFQLPEDVTVYCGHGAATTVGQEKQSNSYM